jgi:hypothetical protein
MGSGRATAEPVKGCPLRARATDGSPPKSWDNPEPGRLDAASAETPPLATPPGVGACRIAAVPVWVPVLEAIRLWVDLNSLPENIGLPDALVGPEELPELLDPLEPEPEDEEPPPDVPPPEDEPEDEDEDEDPPDVRGTACPASAGTAKPTATRNVSVRIDMVMACSLVGSVTTLALCKSTASIHPLLAAGFPYFVAEIRGIVPWLCSPRGTPATLRRQGAVRAE